MNTSSTHLKKNWQIWLARIIAFGLVFAYIWIHIQSIKQYQSNLSEGVVWDIAYDTDENGNYICCITYVSEKASQKGIAIGDQLLNPEADTVGEIDTEVRLKFQTKDSPPREVTFTRQPINFDVYGASVLLGLSARTSTILALILAVFPVVLLVLAALYICWFRSDDWMALLTAVVLIGSYDQGYSYGWADIVIRIINILLWVWVILFPNGKLTPKWAWFPILLSIPREILETPLTQGLNTLAIVLILVILIYRYRRVFSPLERQQAQWLIVGFNLSIFPLVITDSLYTNSLQSARYESAVGFYFINSVIAQLVIFIIVLTILFSVFRYRLYDVSIFSRALVYSSLSTILGVIGFVTVPLIGYFLNQRFGNQSGLLAVLLPALPIAALFNPIRERLQRIVDRFFKPKEVDFESTFVEFSPELSSFFTTKELAILLAKQAVEQLGISYASVFLSEQNEELKRIKTTFLDDELPEPVLDPKTMETIKGGQLAMPDGDSAHTLVVPLVVPRARKPSLLGALVLGPRLDGLGYSTEMQKRLKNFGEVAGKAFYIAELKSRETSNA